MTYRRATFLAATTTGLGVLAIASSAPQPVLLINTSPSEPLGLYLRSAGPATVGALIAFHTPARGKAYVRAHMPELVHGSILKQVVAGAGAVVCNDGKVLTLNGKRLGLVQAHDRRGDVLPSWKGCQVLGPGELFVSSDRIWNSFDSRYYGPVPADELVGVFHPLWTDERGVSPTTVG
jgi:conjugative transfer signal peptidase TraF